MGQQRRNLDVGGQSVMPPTLAVSAELPCRQPRAMTRRFRLYPREFLLRVTSCPDCLVLSPQSFESRLPAGYAMCQYRTLWSPTKPLAARYPPRCAKHVKRVKAAQDRDHRRTD